MFLALSIEEAIQVLRPLLVFVGGMVVYSVFIFHFYQFLGKRDIFELNLSQYNTVRHPFLEMIVGMFLYVVEYILLFPLFAFFWFGVLTLLMSFLSKDQTIQAVLLVSIATVSAVRVTSYYSEALSKDLSKMLPFALLGVFLVDITYFVIGESLDKIFLIPAHINILIYYLGFAIALEISLRILYALKCLFFGNKEEDL